MHYRGKKCSANMNTEKKKEKCIKFYSSSHKILLVGEGDFSFSACLARAFESAANMVATSLDSRKCLRRNYFHAINNLVELEERGCSIVHKVDAHTMRHHPHLRDKSFDRIVFNFPHAGFEEREYVKRQIERHQAVVRGFLRNAREMLTENGEIHITHKTTYPYSEWEIENLAEELGLIRKKKGKFQKWHYPGYTNRKGAGPNCGSSFRVGECKTFKFTRSR